MTKTATEAMYEQAQKDKKEAWDKLHAEIEALRAEREELLALLQRNLERMKLINQKCVHDDLRDCPNHNLMQETESYLSRSREVGK